tara:strand:+ start:5043 stop:5525 length:483 start_codon:yes stop_codon:yes gene_type:complete
MKTYNKFIFFLSLSFFLASCGYQLRGSVDSIGLDSVRIIADNRSSISKILEQKLTVDKESNVSEYPAIKIISITSSKRQLSVNSSGRVDEYEISKVLKYQFIFSEKNKIIETIKASASYDFNEEQMQGTKEREKIANDNIDRTIVRRLVYKFKSALKSNS